MNKLIMIVLVFVGSATFASDLTLPAGVLLQASTAGGFVRPGFQKAHGMRVSESGVVYLFNENTGKTQVLAKLSAKTLFGLKQNVIAHVQDVKLSEPTGPRCMDAPTSVILVRESPAKVVMTKRVESCRPETPVSNLPAEDLNEIVHGLDTLSNLAR